MGDVEADEWQRRDPLPLIPYHWHDQQTIDLLNHRWFNREIEQRIPPEWKNLTAPMNPSRPRASMTPMYDACLSTAWRLL